APEHTRVCDPSKHPQDRSHGPRSWRSEEHTSELQSRRELVCRLLLEKKNKIRMCAEAGELLSTPRFLRTLYRWKDWAGEDEPRKWVTNVVKTDEGLAAFLERCLSTTL